MCTEECRKEYRRELELLDGKLTCLVGQPCPDSASEAFQEGYSKQYAIQEAESAQGAGNEHN